MPAACCQAVNVLLEAIQCVQCQERKDHFGNLLREHNGYSYSHDNDYRCDEHGFFGQTDLLEVRYI